VDAVGEKSQPSSGGRPAELYRRGPAVTLHPAMLRPGPGGDDGEDDDSV
jgi:hypothetical protein